MDDKSFQAVFEVGDVLGDGLYLSDGDGIVIDVNQNYSLLTGIAAEEVIGRNMQSVLNEKYENGDYVVLTIEAVGENPEEPYVSKKPLALCTMVLEEKRSITYLATLSVKGTDKKLIFYGRPYYDVHGKISHVLAIMREMTEMNRLRIRLEEAEQRSRQYLRELTYLRSSHMESLFIGCDSAVERIRQTINHVAKTDATVLITGETGTGKEVLATEIFCKSSRSGRPYIKVNCAAIPDSLLESELFGYEKGAFTGAGKEGKPGYFEMANGGTILLDEIGEMPMKLQSKLLRVLQEREITRVGGVRTIRLDVRVIAATNQELRQKINAGTFREDLYYRLNVIPIMIPPLRERRGDIALLTYMFLEKFSKKHGKSKSMEPSAIDAIEDHEWPGNVRELENTLERLVLIGDESAITDLEVAVVLGKDQRNVYQAGRQTLKEQMDQLERSILEKALKQYKSSHKAAKALGVTQPTVLRKAKALGIDKW